MNHIIYCPKCGTPYGPYSREAAYVKDHKVCPLCAAQQEQETVERLRREIAAGADLLARHNAEIAIYRQALDEIRELCEEGSPAMATLGELAEIADQALNDHRITGGSK